MLLRKDLLFICSFFFHRVHLTYDSKILKLDTRMNDGNELKEKFQVQKVCFWYCQ